MKDRAALSEALDKAWLASPDARGHARPPDLASYLYQALSPGWRKLLHQDAASEDRCDGRCFPDECVCPEDGWEAEADRKAVRISRLEKALNLARPRHLIVDGDCWFSCPKARYEDRFSDPESSACCNEEEVKRGLCTCGADEMNALIDKILVGDA